MLTSQRLFLKSQHIRLCCVDFGGKGSPLLLLHGLAGRAHEWHHTAQWLTQHGHVFALDQRGHGMSQKGLADYSREAYVNDVITVIEHLRLAMFCSSVNRWAAKTCFWWQRADPN